MLFPAAAQAGLSISVVSAPSVSGNDHPKWTGTTDGGGNTSVANDSDDLIKHSSLSECCGHYTTAGNDSTETAYFQRDRDLGQTFTYSGTTGRKLDRITIKTGAGTNVVRTGTYGQAVSLQLFKITGSCSVNNNGSTTYGKHGYPHGPANQISAHRDDYCTGETYTSLAVVSGGTFPSASAFGCSGTPDPNDNCLKGKYLRFDLTGSDEITLTNGETYAFLLMIDDEGANAGFTLANDGDGNPFSGGHGIRREGDGSFPPVTADPTKSITDSANASARASGDFGSWSGRIGRSPGTNGYPDVDTLRDHWFVAETAAGSSTTTTDSATNAGWGRRDQATTVQTGWLNVRSDSSGNDKQRKSWVRFDLSNDGINWSTASSVQLELKTAEQPSTSSCGRTLTVYAMPTSSTWPSGGISWNDGPSNNTSSAWAFNSATQLGTYSLPCQESVDSVITVNLDVDYFKNDSDKIVILGMSYGADTSGASFKAYESGTSGPKMKVTYDPSSSTTVTDSATNSGWGRRDQGSTVQTGWLNVRSETSSNDRQRKSWLKFDLSNDGITWTSATSVKLELTVAEQPSTSSCGRTLTVYAMPTSSTWPSGGVSWNDGPSNNTSSAWAFNSATQLGTYSLPCQESVNSVVSVDLDVNYFKNDSDKVVILGMSFGQDTTGSSFKVYESGTSGPKMKVTY